MFDQPSSSSDGGALLLKLADDRLGLTRAVARVLPDSRASEKVKHTVLEVIKQRVFGIAAGYEDANDAARLRHDPAHQLIVKDTTGPELASQPTIWRGASQWSESEVT